MGRYFASKSKGISKREIENAEEVRKLAAQCMVLMENDGVLPIKGTQKNIALFGSGARRTVKGGTGSGDVNSRYIISIEEGLEAAGFNITTKKWLNEYDKLSEEKREEYNLKLEEKAKDKGVSVFTFAFEHPFKAPGCQPIMEADIKNSASDTAIYVISRNSGEGADRCNEGGDYLLSADEIEAITLLGKKYVKLIVLLNIGGIIDTTVLKSIEGVNAILLVGQSGSMGGYAVADVITGKVTPSGKLSDTWAASYYDYPSSESFSHNNGNLDDEYYKEGIYVGYRYFDSFNVKPNYCFGYGLSYTSFNIEVTSIIACETEISLRINIKNTGDTYSGREVVQIYYSAPQGKLNKPYQGLAAFAKSKLLAPGEEENMTIAFKTSSMASYTEEESSWVLEAGDYIIRVGNSSRNTRVAAVINLDKKAVVEKLKKLFYHSENIEEISASKDTLYNYEGEKEEIAKAKKLFIYSSKIKEVIVEYKNEKPIYKDFKPEKKLTMGDVLNGKASIEELTAQLTLREMAELCVGSLCAGGSSASIIGSASASAPGAAGDTTSLMIADRNIRNIILADGPAGLRLTPHFQTSLQGELLPGGEIFLDMPREELIQSEDKVDYYQHCTAVPIAWMLAQSWDAELIEKVGYIVGKEMLEFQVTLWLAPGMNIHRNPLCGRNFEYYSEDPLLSGICAAADTKGIQSHPGIGTTIKHFAANNQEDNRMFNNAHITERTLREIYLKGFEIVVKSAQPMAIMSSYNLINGIHTANSYDLLTSVARDEWGFQGFIMTDWFTSQDVSFMFGAAQHKYPISSSVLCIKSGNDLQMPGSEKNVEDIVEAAENGELTLGELQHSARNILNIILKSNCYENALPYAEQFNNLSWYIKKKNKQVRYICLFSLVY